MATYAEEHRVPVVKCWTCGDMMQVFHTEDGDAAGYFCASCPTCLAKLVAAAKAEADLDND
jgi:hypothetical protein